MRIPKYIILLAVIFISGCWDRTEMNDIAFVTATALDLADNGNIICYLQIAAPTSSKGGMSGGEAVIIKVLMWYLQKEKQVTRFIKSCRKKLS